MKHTTSSCGMVSGGKSGFGVGIKEMPLGDIGVVGSILDISFRFRPLSKKNWDDDELMTVMSDLVWI